MPPRQGYAVDSVIGERSSEQTTDQVASSATEDNGHRGHQLREDRLQSSPENLTYSSLEGSLRRDDRPFGKEDLWGINPSK